MTEPLFWQPGRPPSPPFREPRAPALLDGQLTLDGLDAGAALSAPKGSRLNY